MNNLVIDAEISKSTATVVDFVYSVIKKNILNWNLKPGLRISEKDTAEHLNVSKTPVRESFIRLSKEKLIDILPQRGSFVAKINLKDVEEGLFIRRSLELSILEIAIKSITGESLTRMKEYIQLQQQAIFHDNFADFLKYDENFHREIFLTSNKERTWKIMSEANIQYRRLRMLTLIDINKSDMILHEHLQLVSALENKDLENAKRVIDKHLGKIHFEEGILKNRYPDYFI